MIHSVKGFGIVKKKTKVVIFLELSCFFNDPADVGNMISGSSAFSKTSLNRADNISQSRLSYKPHNYSNCTCIVGSWEMGIPNHLTSLLRNLYAGQDATVELQPTRLLRPWDFPGKSTGVGCHYIHINMHINIHIYTCKHTYIMFYLVWALYLFLTSTKYPCIILKILFVTPSFKSTFFV